MTPLDHIKEIEAHFEALKSKRVQALETTDGQIHGIVVRLAEIREEVGGIVAVLRDATSASMHIPAADVVRGYKRQHKWYFLEALKGGPLVWNDLCRAVLDAGFPIEDRDRQQLIAALKSSKTYLLKSGVLSYDPETKLYSKKQG